MQSTHTSTLVAIPERHADRVAELIESGQVHRSWFEHPLVAGALRHTVKGDPLQVIVNLHNGLRWVEEHGAEERRHTPVASRPIHWQNGDVETFRSRLEREGYGEQEIRAILEYQAPRLSLRRLPAQQVTEIRDRIGYLQAMGWPASIIAQHMGLSARTVKDQARLSRLIG